MNTFTALHTVIMATTQHVPAKFDPRFRRWHLWSREQWKLTDISRMSIMSIQGAFGDSMWPSIQGLVGRERLPAVLVPGMKDDICSLSGLLNPNGTTGAKDMVQSFSTLTHAKRPFSQPYAMDKRLTQLTKSMVYMFSDRTCLYLLRHIYAHYSHIRSHYLQPNISMNSMAAILSLVFID